MNAHREAEAATGDQPPAGERADRGGLARIVVGLGLAVLLTIASFWAAGTHLVYGPAVPVLLAALAIGQMGVHLVFFLHISSAPDQTNNFLALAFGCFVVGLVVFGSMIIVSNLNANMAPMSGQIMPEALTPAAPVQK
jgi:cytochrome o ubiquinol oxidase operon protein cyoD